MTMPFSYVEAPQLIGGWPILPNFSTPGDVALVPRVLRNRATILGVQKETTAGYAVRAQSFYVEVDSDSLLVTFSAGADPLALDEVVAEINALSQADVNINADIARRDGGFLRLESPTVGGDSTLLLLTNSVSAGEPLYTLGLFPSTSSRGGELASSEQYDPDRQLIYPGQLIMAEGEDLEARTINRSIMQLALNSDFSNNLLRKKQMAKIVEVSVTNPGAGFYIADTVYTGPSATPIPEALEDVISVLDANGDEAVKEDEDVRSSGLSMTFSIEANTGEQLVTSTGAFLSTDPKDDIYVLSADVGMSGLQNVRLKVLRWISNDQVAVRNVGTNGVRYPLSVAITDGKVLSYVAAMVRANRLLTGPAGTRVEQLTGSKKTGTVTRVDFNNRIVCTGTLLDFVAQAIVGDKVVLAGHTGTAPYNNDGTYRVSKIINKNTVELMTLDFGPVILNPSGTALGTFDLRYNGDFYYNPYVELTFSVPTGTYRVLYRKQSTLNEISSDPAAFSSIPLKYQQEADAHMQEAIRRIQGPSASSYMDIIYNDARLSLEDLDYRLENEHDEGGHHTVVRANQIGIGASRFTPPGTTFLEVRTDTDWKYGLNFSQDFHTFVGKSQSKQLTFIPVGAVSPNGENAGIHFQGPILTSGVTPVYGRLAFYQESDALVDPTWTAFTIAASQYSPLDCSLNILASGAGDISLYGATVYNQGNVWLPDAKTLTLGTKGFNLSQATATLSTINFKSGAQLRYDHTLDVYTVSIGAAEKLRIAGDTSTFSYPNSGSILLSASVSSGYAARFTLDDVSLQIGHNSGARRLDFVTDDTIQVSISPEGQLAIGATTFPADGMLLVNNKLTSAAGQRVARFYSPNISNTHTHYLHIGKADSARNTGEIGWYHLSDGSVGNYVTLGMYGLQHIHLLGTGDVEIVNGNISSFSDAGNLVLSGGEGGGSGANIELYGPDHATVPNQAFYDAVIHTFRPVSGSTGGAYLRAVSTNSEVEIGAYAPAGQNAAFGFTSGSLRRWWIYRENTAESGSNAGSNFAVARYSDAGGFLGTPLNIVRSTGNVGINNSNPLNAQLWVTQVTALSRTAVFGPGGSAWCEASSSGGGYGLVGSNMYLSTDNTIRVSQTHPSGYVAGMTFNIGGIGITRIVGFQGSVTANADISSSVPLAASFNPVTGQNIMYCDTLNVGRSSTAAVALELGADSVANSKAVVIDFHAVGNSDYNFRIVRNSGTNGSAVLEQLGSGSLYVSTQNGTGPVELVGSSSATAAVFVWDGSTNIAQFGNASYALDVIGSLHYTSAAASSDLRFKENIETLSGCLSKVRALRGVAFNWNQLHHEYSNSNFEREYGFIAQEAESVIPELVRRWKRKPEDTEYMAINYERMIPVLVEAIKELAARVEALEAA